MDSDTENLSDSDLELQIALSTGKLKPGVYLEVDKKKHAIVNKTNVMKTILQKFRSNDDQLERMVFETTFKREMLEESSADAAGTETAGSKLEDRFVNDDLKREKLFMHQSQNVIVQAARLFESKNVPFERPHDYYAEMAKSDSHMHKVREKLAERVAINKRAERVREIRMQRQQKKELDKRQKLEKQQIRHEIKDQLARLKKKKQKHGDGDEDGFGGDRISKKSGGKVTKSKNRTGGAKANNKRQRKEKDFGFGGKKRGSKRNTKDSANYMEKRKKSQGGGGRNKAGRKAAAEPKNRPGKMRRQQMRSKRNRR